MLLWIVLAVLTAAVLLPLLWPLARSRAAALPSAAHDAEIYRAQLREVDAQADQGLIQPAEADTARAEIARRLIAADRQARSATQERDGVPHPALMAGIAIFIPATALGFYLVFGSPALPDQPLAARLDPGRQQTVDSLIAQVEARLRENPEDAEGWDVIAPVYARLQRYDEAAEAYRRAMQMSGEVPARLVGFGEAATLANNGIVPEIARRAFEKAKAGNPNLIKAHYWLAVALEQDGKFAEAAESWRALLNSGGADAPWRGPVEQRLAQAEARVKGAPGPSEEDVAAAKDMTLEQREQMIAQMVDRLDKKLAANGDDLDGWVRLVRAYTVLGKRDAALGALERAKTQFQGNQSALTTLGELAQTLGLSS